MEVRKGGVRKRVLEKRKNPFAGERRGLPEEECRAVLGVRYRRKDRLCTLSTIVKIRIMIKTNIR
jgi:hypothetical protein